MQAGAPFRRGHPVFGQGLRPGLRKELGGEGLVAEVRGAALGQGAGELRVGVAVGHALLKGADPGGVGGRGLFRVRGFGAGFRFRVCPEVVDDKGHGERLFRRKDRQEADGGVGGPGSQQGGVRVLQEGQKTPVVERVGPKDLQRRHGLSSVEPGGNAAQCALERVVLHVFLRGVAGREDQLFLRAGHGDIEDPESLRTLAAQGGLFHGGMDEGGVGKAGVWLTALQSDAQFGVQDEALVQLAVIELVLEVGDNTDFELQPLALVDGHDLHDVGVGGQGGGHVQRAVLFPEPVHVPDEAGGAAGTVGVVAVRVVEQHLQVGHPLLADVHGADNGVVGGLLIDAPQQFAGAHGEGERAVGAQLVQELCAVGISVLFTFQDRLIEVPFPRVHPEGRHFVFFESEEGRQQHGEERHVLDRVVDDRKQGQHGHDFRGVQEAGAGFGIDRNAGLGQHFAVCRGRGAWGPHEDGKVFIVQRTVGVLAFSDFFGDVPGDVRGLRLPFVDALLRDHDGEFHIGFFALRIAVLRAEIELFGLVIADFAHGPAHEPGEGVVDRPEDALPAAEILSEDDGGGVLVFLRIIEVVALFFREEEFRHGLAEAVDALLDVADHEEVVLREGGEDGVLQLVGVLVLVDEDLLELLPQVLCQLFPFKSLGGGVFHQEFERHEFGVGKVEGVFFAFEFGVDLVEPEDRVHQFLREGFEDAAVNGRIFRRREGVSRKLFLQFAFRELRFGLFAELQYGRGFSLRERRLFQLGNVEVRDGFRKGAPVLVFHECLQFFDLSNVPFDACRRPGIVEVGLCLLGIQNTEDAGPAPGPAVEGFQSGSLQEPVGSGRVIKERKAGFQPVPRGGIGPGVGVEPPDVLLNGGVVPAGGQEFHEAGEGGVLCGIELFQDPVHGVLLQDFLFGLVQHAEVRGNAEVLEVLPHEVAAEGVYGADVRGGEEHLLVLQVLVVRVFQQPIGDGFGEPVAHFGGGGPGEGDDEEFVGIAGVVRVQEPADAPLDKNSGLARAGGRADNEGAAPGVDSLLLVRGPLHVIRHGLPPPRRSFSP